MVRAQPGRLAQARQALGRLERMAISPSTVLRMLALIRDIDVRAALAAHPRPETLVRSTDGASHEVEVSAFPILTAHGSQGAIAIFWPPRERQRSAGRREGQALGHARLDPLPGPETIRYGGNTSCVGVTLSDGSLLALDAGTGIRSLGLALPDEPTRLHILLTHLHLDHIQGLVFFAPAFRPQTEIVIWGPASPEASLRDRIARYISAPLSPVEVRELPCDVSFRHCPESEWEIGPARIRAASVSHRGPTLGYRIDDGGSSLAYIPDHEPALGADLDALDEDWISGFALARDASLLIHDGQYSDAEYPEHVGWGHSALSDALAFARRTGAERTVLFHHDPLHSDELPRPPRRAKRSERWAALGGAPGAIELARRAGRVRAAGAARRSAASPRPEPA